MKNNFPPFKINGPTKILRKIEIPDYFNSDPPLSIKKGLIVDVETTGLNLHNHEAIQIGLLPFEYDPKTGLIYRVNKNDAISQLSCPIKVIPKKITMLTGISMDMVEGESFDLQTIDNSVHHSDIIFSHNASFDRPFCEKISSSFENKPWACTLNGINWSEHGFTSRSLEHLSYQFGYYYDSHKALNDCEAVLALLSMYLKISKGTVLKVLRDYCLQDKFLIQVNSYNKKDKLKDRGYMFNGVKKLWWITVNAEDLHREKDWLQEEVYGVPCPISHKKIDCIDLYSRRMI